MKTRDITSAELESLIQDNEIVFVDFWAAWCAPCKQFAVSYEQVAEKFPGICFAKVNIEVEQELADLFEIRSIPHLLVFKEGIVIYSNAGSMPPSTLNELVEQALAADVSDIKAQIQNHPDE